MKDRRFLVDGIVHSSGLSACIEMAVDGMGVALLPKVLVQKMLDESRLVQLDHKWVPAPLKFVARFNLKTAPQFV